jgi:hypothetical protein
MVCARSGFRPARRGLCVTWCAREDVRGDLIRARHGMGKLLSRHDVRYDGEGRLGLARGCARYGHRGVD